MSFCGNISIIGGGSWATALANVVLQNVDHICWYIHKEESIEAFKKLKHNPSYLSSISFDITKITFTSDINEAVNCSDTLIFAIPSPYLVPCVEMIKKPCKVKHIISATKGVPPKSYISISQYLKSVFELSDDNVAVISGPSHAEEVASKKSTYLTMACRNLDAAKHYSALFNCDFLHLRQADDIIGIEYSGILKNIFAIAAGICHGLRHGDNFQAALISNAIDEIRCILDIVDPSQKRNIFDSVYAGDMLVTAYSKFSRNFLFGSLVSNGNSVGNAMAKMGMVAEGYYSTAFVYEKSRSDGNILPIVDFVYDVLYGGVPAEVAIKKLEDLLK